MYNTAKNNYIVSNQRTKATPGKPLSEVLSHKMTAWWQINEAAVRNRLQVCAWTQHRHDPLVVNRGDGAPRHEHRGVLVRQRQEHRDP